MDKQIISFIDSIRSEKKLTSFDEESVKQAIVMKLLFLLDWNIFDIDEVRPNYPIKKNKIDYALRLKNSNKVFISIKKVGEPLKSCQPELIEWFSKEGAEFFILTNGVGWWFYLLSNNGNFEQNRFCALDLLEQKSDNIAKQLKTFLDKKIISKGAALKTAQELQKERRQKIFSGALPEAWKKLVSEPHALLVKLLSEATEEICGFSPERGAAIKFLTDALNCQQTLDPIPSKEERKPSTQTYDGQSISSFSFKGHEYKLKSWNEMLVKLCDILESEYKQDIENLQWHSVGKKYYFSKNKSDLRFPEKINGAEIFVETYLTPNEVIRAAFSVITFFGYTKDDFLISSKNA